MKLTAYKKTSILAAAVMLAALWRDGGFLVIILVAVLLVCMLYALARLAFKPAERRARAIQLAVWVALFWLAGASVSYWSDARKEHANAVAAAVVAFKERTGRYPASMAETGQDEAALQTDWGIRYRQLEGKPRLAYPDHAVPLSSHEYDFEAHEWKLNAY